VLAEITGMNSAQSRISRRIGLDGPDDIRALVVQRNDNTDASRLGSYERHQSACQVVEL
jgi:hypothetical protein